MGANYDFVIAPAAPGDELASHIVTFVIGGHVVDCIDRLNHVEILDDRAILWSAPCNGWVQIIASASGLGVPLAEWFHRNPLARALSLPYGRSIHVWTLDSGACAGYSVFQNGSMRERITVFAKDVTSHTELMPGVSVLPNHPGKQLREATNETDYDFKEDTASCRTLEIGVARLIGKFGFPVQLVDFYDAVDEQEGANVIADKYFSVPLHGWTALLFH
jgi:hypothetical protein